MRKEEEALTTPGGQSLAQCTQWPYVFIRCRLEENALHRKRGEHVLYILSLYNPSVIGAEDVTEE